MESIMLNESLITRSGLRKLESLMLKGSLITRSMKSKMADMHFRSQFSKITETRVEDSINMQEMSKMYKKRGHGTGKQSPEVRISLYSKQ